MTRARQRRAAGLVPEPAIAVPVASVVRATTQALDDPAKTARWLRSRDPVRILGLRRLIVVLVAEGAHRDGDHPVRGIGEERPGVADGLLGLRFRHSAPSD